MNEDEELTDIEIKLASTGGVYILAASSAVYLEMSEKLDELSGMPQLLTDRVIPLDPETLTDGRKFQRIPKGRLAGKRALLVIGAITDGLIDQLSQAEFDAVKPESTGL